MYLFLLLTASGHRMSLPLTHPSVSCLPTPSCPPTSVGGQPRWKTTITPRCSMFGESHTAAIMVSNGKPDPPLWHSPERCEPKPPPPFRMHGFRDRCCPAWRFNLTQRNARTKRKRRRRGVRKRARRDVKSTTNKSSKRTCGRVDALKDDPSERFRLSRKEGEDFFCPADMRT